ncbi:MAG: Protein GrpE [Cellvibrionales bacterium UBA7375]|nr:nucleotide exchange factor GrpE [Gammaproteobacteria bacterium]CAI8168941.1 MAG: Protein GrpE [Cellvibrionales bacterium UBA7375]
MSQDTNQEDTAAETQQPEVEVDEKLQAEVELDQAELAEEQAETQIEELQQKLSTLGEQLLREQAEMQNVRRRAQRDIESAHKYALEKFASELLSVVDNLERAIEAIDAEDEAQKAVAEGLELTLKTFIEVLGKYNLEAVDPEGQPFDADLHQAVSTVPNNDVEPNTVINVFQKGYTLNGRLIRPAMVVVSTSA